MRSEVTSGGPPGVSVVVPATRLVGSPVNGIPPMIYVERAGGGTVLVSVLDPEVSEPGPVPTTVEIGAPSVVFLPSSTTAPVEADRGIDRVWLLTVAAVAPAVIVWLSMTRLVGFPYRVKVSSV